MMLCTPDGNRICTRCGKPLGVNRRICPGVRIPAIKPKTQETEPQKTQEPTTEHGVNEHVIAEHVSTVGRVSVVRPADWGPGPCDACDQRDENGLCEPATRVVEERTACHCSPAEYRIRNYMGMVNCEKEPCPENPQNESVKVNPRSMNP